MKILVAGRGVTGIAAGSGGAELAMYHLAKGAVLAGHRVTLVETLDETKFPVPEGMTVVAVGGWPQRVVRRLPKGFGFWIVRHLVGNVGVALAVRRTLRRDPHELVHIYGALAALLVSTFSSVPVIYTEQDATPWICRYRRWWERAIRKLVFKRVNRPAYRRASHVAVVFDAMRDELVGRWSVPAEKVTTIMNGTDVDLFNPNRPGVSLVRERFGFERYCLFVGHLSSRKAPDLLLEAVSELDGVKCAFVGDGPMRRCLERNAQQRGIADRVAFLGNVTPAELGRVYADADLLVLPSVSEGAPLVVFEAMSCGTPVLATQVAGLPNLVRDWETGFLVKPGDLGQLVIAIRFLLSDPKALRRMGQKAQRLIRQRFLWPSLTRQYLELYSQVTCAPAAEPAPRLPAEVQVA
jgi:glycosyltransferase involved in cell wall biosynthesis